MELCGASFQVLTFFNLDSTTRYLIIALLVAVFVILSPLILMYVTGRTLPFFDPLPTNTGIIDVQSEPNGATVLLDGEEIGSTPATVRFVKQGWHQVQVRLEDFRPWQKQLFIEAGEVTYAGNINDAIRLLPEAEPMAIDSGVETFTIVDNQILYTKGRQILLYDVIDNTTSRQTTLPFTITRLEETNNKNLWFINTDTNQRYLLNSSNWETSLLPSAFNDATELSLVDNNTVSGLVNNNLIIGKFGNTQTETLLTGVLGYTIKDGLFYIASQNQTVSQIATYNWTGTALNQQLVIISEGIPLNQSVKFYLTNQKELFMLAGENFYRVNQNLELLNSFTRYVDFDPANQRLSYVTPTEIYFYNFSSNRSELLARSTEGLSSASVIPSFGYGFLAGPSGTEAVEIDSRGNQNRYNLFSNPSQQIFITANQKAVVIRSENNLYSVLIQK